MARVVRPGPGSGLPSGRTKLPTSGKTVAEAAREGSGRSTARAPRREDRLVHAYAGELPYNLQEFISEDLLKTLKHGGQGYDFLERKRNGGVFSPIDNARPTKAQLDELVHWLNEEGTHDYNPTQYTAGQTEDPDEEELETTDYRQVWTSAAPLSDMPTATTNVNRPRTVAAGYSVVGSPDQGQKNGKITVVFRDGTYYNYYQCSLQDWDEFTSAPSKGYFIRNHLDYHPRGNAAVGNLPAAERAQVYALIRAEQAGKAKFKTIPFSEPKIKGASSRPRGGVSGAGKKQQWVVAPRAARKRRVRGMNSGTGVTWPTPMKPANRAPRFR